MARRPVFAPVLTGPAFVREVELEFDWFPGFAVSQAQKSIASLHAAARTVGLSPVLEISSKSADPLGVRLSAFHLSVEVGGRSLTVETAFQGSKVFERGGPYHDLYAGTSREAKKDDRLRTSGRLTGFDLLGETWPTEPTTAFYDWLYLSALHQQPEMGAAVRAFAAFSDIAFNPEKSINCQARSAALYVALHRRGRIDTAMKSRQAFLDTLAGR
jgi:hypothetical protein